MIIVVTQFCPEVPEIIPHFVNHYKEADKIVCTVHETPEYTNKLNQMYEQLKKVDIEPESVDVGEFSERNLNFNFHRLQRIAGEDDWVIFAEPDEFIDFPGGITSFFSSLDNEINCVLGYIIDRIDKDFDFPEMLFDVSIWEQFPVEFPMTKKVEEGRIDKVCAVKNLLRVSPGHHILLEKEKPAFEFEERLKVFHFKWDATVLEKTRRRITLNLPKYRIERYKVLHQRLEEIKKRKWEWANQYL